MRGLYLFNPETGQIIQLYGWTQPYFGSSVGSIIVRDSRGNDLTEVSDLKQTESVRICTGAGDMPGVFLVREEK